MEIKRALLKISGQILGEKDKIFSKEIFYSICEEIANVFKSLKVEIAIVVGGGNILRGSESEKIGIDRVTGDYMGMLATCINSLAMQNILEKMGVPTRVLSAIEMNQIAEPYIRRRAIRHLEKKRIVIFASGTGNPYFSTDTAAALRAIEIEADIFLKGTKVDGIYSEDPIKNPNAKFYEEIDYDEILKKDLKILDASAVALCKENNLPIIVFNFTKRGNLEKIFKGEKIGTIVRRI
ncbi:MAG: UMP kinase [candidate division WOR-3 bacterium]|uniref:Uridylate kinase n=1 Tax=candidate division WOR-3 bacterium TaxID=2052148 RepID=A0A7V4ABS2_UNCW3